MDILSLSLRKENTLAAVCTVKKKGVSVKALEQTESVLYSLMAGNVDDVAVFLMDAVQMSGGKKMPIYISLPACIVQTEYYELKYLPQDLWHVSLVPQVAKFLHYEREDRLAVDFPLAYLRPNDQMCITAACTDMDVIETLMEAAELAEADIESVETEAVAALRFMGTPQTGAYFAEIDRDATSLISFWPSRGLRSVTVPSFGYGELLQTVDGVAKFAQTIALFDAFVQKTYGIERVGDTPIHIFSERESEIMRASNHGLFRNRLQPIPYSDKVYAPEYTDEEVVTFAGPIGLALKPIYERMSEEDEALPDNELYPAGDSSGEELSAVQDETEKRNARLSRLFGTSHGG